jgi:hypothetical protein
MPDFNDLPSVNTAKTCLENKRKCREIFEDRAPDAFANAYYFLPDWPWPQAMGLKT